MTEEQWQAIQNRDDAYDGAFYYALKSSSTICRPSCTARKATPENVIIFTSLEDGIKAGYRPCSRCCPDRPEWQGAKKELVKRTKAYIQTHYTEKFSLSHLADELFVNKIYLSKCFKEITGTTLLHYYNQVRCEEAGKLLRDPDLNVELVSSRVGFVTSSHFARVFRSFYQCSPTEYRKAYFKSMQQN